MHMIQRVASRYLKAKDNTRYEMGVWDSKKVKFKIDKGYGSTGIIVYYGRKRIGVCVAREVYGGDYLNKEIKCQSDVEKLAAQYPQVWDEKGAWLGREKGYVPAPRIYAVHTSKVADEHTGKRIGLAMYRALASVLYKEHGPLIFISDGCSTVGSTSDDAKRVWLSLSRNLPSSGTCVAILKAPTIKT